MGSLTPGATYVYESPDGGETVYARESGKTERVLIGESYKAIEKREKILNDQLWYDIGMAAKTNPGLHEALERVKIMYHLSKDNG
jgi:hypothetical protein